MSKFLLFTDAESENGTKPVIVNTDNIGRVYTEMGNTYIEMNYARGSDRYPRSIHVKESFEWVKNLLEASQ